MAQTILTHRTRAGDPARAGSGLFLLLNIQADAALDELGGFFHALAAREIACGFLGDDIEHVLIVVNKGRRGVDQRQHGVVLLLRDGVQLDHISFL